MDTAAPLTFWLMIAETIRNTAGTAFLAGGCLRDLDNGRPFKDVDIFVPQGSDVDAILAALREDFGTADIERETSFTSCDEMRDVLASVNFVVGRNATQVNVVVLEGNPTMAWVLDRMDFGLCQIGHDGEHFIRTDAYVRDALEGSLTLTRRDCDASYARSLKRYERLAEKYRGWTLVDRFA